MIFRPDRRPRGADRTLPHRMALFAGGAVLALAGILWQRSILVISAMVVLATGLAVGQLERHRADPDDSNADDENAAGSGPVPTDHGDTDRSAAGDDAGRNAAP